MKVLLPIDKNEIVRRYKPVSFDTHKGIQGHAMIIAGSYGKIGAAVLATKSCIKSGCGLVTAFIPRCGYHILQLSNPEVMVVTDDVEKRVSNIAVGFHPDAIGLGPGLGMSPQTQKAVIHFLRKHYYPMVIDADGLNILAKNTEGLYYLKPKTILTPHLKELKRLIGEWLTEEEKWEKAIAFSLKYNLIIVMKGAPTYIIDGTDVYQNSTGNAALATAGSGDVLTGIITSLLAQSYTPLNAAIIGVYLHGLTADIALPDMGTQSFIASDIIAYLGKAFLSLEKA
ncbi:NAD(P)H-hydrate dehydratase [Flavobacterium sp. UMI-01]|uniref:NAD(P)H-hydrate dehydratase n=1 Tax=Flavobacterium sp. UMI-01 TaxID=1441053 RepID=UPI001C7DEE60|nr:NAD(P)H-hydrate dehydratase [Flavobacterium sp. UMI-01]GIZ08687.1 ADP-dependent (S)-NAD(P)H-hydrate dehydratase [Flavobacterium sp. UMI-01]